MGISDPVGGFVKERDVAVIHGASDRADQCAMRFSLFATYRYQQEDAIRMDGSALGVSSG